MYRNYYKPSIRIPTGGIRKGKKHFLLHTTRQSVQRWVDSLPENRKHCVEMNFQDSPNKGTEELNISAISTPKTTVSGDIDSSNVLPRRLRSEVKNKTNVVREFKEVDNDICFMTRSQSSISRALFRSDEYGQTDLDDINSDYSNRDLEFNAFTPSGKSAQRKLKAYEYTDAQLKQQWERYCEEKPWQSKHSESAKVISTSWASAQQFGNCNPLQELTAVSPVIQHQRGSSPNQRTSIQHREDINMAQANQQPNVFFFFDL